MQAYFSHSYRDVPTNAYFTGLFEEAGIELRADQKTDVWCMAKLERYMFEMDGFVSIIPQRTLADGSIAYSPYIGRELMLARRARTPRVVFVDDQLLDRYTSDFPETAVPFFHGGPELYHDQHVRAIKQFRNIFSRGGGRPPREYVAKQCTVVAGDGAALRDAASRVRVLLQEKGYKIISVPCAADLEKAFDNIDVFEAIVSSELCVFLLDKDLSCPDVLLAMAHAHCIPTVRLRYDPQSESSAPELSGAIRWKSPADLKSSFSDLLENYLSVFATASGDEQALQSIGTTKSISAPPGIWDPRNGSGLLDFVLPDDRFVSDRVKGVMRMLDIPKGSRESSDAVCRLIYDRIKQDRFYYTFEPVLSDPTMQKIRRPQQIGTDSSGTCIDLACFFASMLEAAHENPVLIVIGIGRFRHAVAGYFTPDAIKWTSTIHLGDVRLAIRRGELVVFEATGAVEAIQSVVVAAETELERKEGGRMLDYQTAKQAATRLLTTTNDVELIHFIDVSAERRARS